jgi:hypothetical protein
VCSSGASAAITVSNQPRLAWHVLHCAPQLRSKHFEASRCKQHNRAQPDAASWTASCRPWRQGLTQLSSQPSPGHRRAGRISALHQDAAGGILHHGHAIDSEATASCSRQAGGTRTGEREAAGRTADGAWVRPAAVAAELGMHALPPVHMQRRRCFKGTSNIAGCCRHDRMQERVHVCGG